MKPRKEPALPFGPPPTNPPGSFGPPPSQPPSLDPKPSFGGTFEAPPPLVPAQDLARRLKRAASDLDFTDPDRASELYAHAKRIEDGEDLMVQDVAI